MTLTAHLMQALSGKGKHEQWQISGIFRHGSKKRFGHAIRHASIAAMSLPPSQYRENLRLAGSTLSTMPESSRGKILPFAAAVAMRARGKSL